MGESRKRTIFFSPEKLYNVKRGVFVYLFVVFVVDDDDDGSSEFRNRMMRVAAGVADKKSIRH